MRMGLLLLTALLVGCKDSAPPPPMNSMRPPSTMPTPERALTFEADRIGAPPTSFTAALTGEGRQGVWQVQQALDAPSGQRVLVQTDADRTNYRFPVLVYDGLSAKDVDVSVRFKAISGRVDQAAGLVWRFRDPNNYYVVRANALEDNVVLYKVENGKRIDLPVKGLGDDTYGVEADVPDTGWGTLRVTARGPLFEVYLGDRKLFEVEDATFQEAGKVGLWTKADSVTQFDDLAIANLDRQSAPGQ